MTTKWGKSLPAAVDSSIISMFELFETYVLIIIHRIHRQAGEDSSV